MTLVITIVNSVNNDQVGDIIRFAIKNIDKINALSFQPVSFTGRDEEIDDETRKKQRYTLSHLASDVKTQAGLGEPMRDWFPLSASGPFSDLRDLLGGLEAEWGSLKCGCHPNCGIATMVLVHEKTGDAVPVTQLLDVDQLLRDLTVITDAARGRFLTVLQAALATARNIRPAGVPKNLGVLETLKIMDGHTGKSMGIAKEGRYPWRVLLVAGMWFQDLFNYDFRRTEMCIIPYGTQLGEISFCAYNTGAGWRQIIEEMHQTATLADWYRDKGRHPIYAGGKAVPLPTYRPRPVDLAGGAAPGREGGRRDGAAVVRDGVREVETGSRAGRSDPARGHSRKSRSRPAVSAMPQRETRARAMQTRPTVQALPMKPRGPRSREKLAGDQRDRPPDEVRHRGGHGGAEVRAELLGGDRDEDGPVARCQAEVARQGVERRRGEPAHREVRGDAGQASRG